MLSASICAHLLSTPRYVATANLKVGLRAHVGHDDRCQLSCAQTCFGEHIYRGGGPWLTLPRPACGGAVPGCVSALPTRLQSRQASRHTGYKSIDYISVSFACSVLCCMRALCVCLCMHVHIYKHCLYSVLFKI